MSPLVQVMEQAIAWTIFLSTLTPYSVTRDQGAEKAINSTLP